MNIDSLCQFVYPLDILSSAYIEHNIFKNRAILAIHNDTVLDFNIRILQALTGPLHTFTSEDAADLNETEPGIDQLPVKYLQSLNPPGLPSLQL